MIKNKFHIMKTLKQKKYSILINNYLNNIFIIENKNNYNNIIITVIYVYINKNYTNSNIYLTIYPKNIKKKFIKK
ncbi:MAG: hypothetical protein NHG07_00305 [Candidatus Shikimatogenerans bostrichidophilus]|nr:MAG: hypothetical protein NHG07_00305 [Candidatus Shikimatogenerans bostrichidophilus]